MTKVVTAIFKPSPVKIGLLATLAALLLCRYGLNTIVDENIRRIDIQIQDLMFRARGTLPLPRGKERREAVIVDIDEKSLAQYGQWPWPRDVVADLLKKIDSARPKAIGLDMVFAEPDRSSLNNVLKKIAVDKIDSLAVPEAPDARGPEELIASLKKILGKGVSLAGKQLAALDHDLMLARVVENSPAIVLGYFFVYNHDGLRKAGEVPYGAGNFILTRKPGAMASSPFAGWEPYRPVLNIPVLDDAAEDRSGCFSTGFDDSGKVRKIPLVWEFEGNLYPLLSLQMLRIGLGEPNALVMVGAGGVEEIKFRALSIPTDVLGRFYINFRGPQKTFPYISAADVLAGKVDPAIFKDRYVLLGTSAGGLRDLRATPFEDDCPGVEVHANVIDNILTGDFIYVPEWAHGMEQIFIIVTGIFLALFVAYSRPLFGGVVTLGLLAAIPFGNYYLMFPCGGANGYILSTAYPLLTVVLVFATVTLFNYFFEGKKKRFIKDAFSTYLSREVVDQLVSAPDKLSLKGEERVLTVLFSDIRGFTTISEQLSAEGLANFLNEYLTPMADIVMATQGCVDKFIGDAVVAFWGAPVADPEHAIHAAQCSLRMISALAEMRPRWLARGLPPINIGIGLNTGPMRVGNMGSTTRFDYTVMGDNVNLGSRLENLNKTYGTSIIVSAATRAALGGKFFCRVLDKVRVKGKQEPVTIYELLCEGEPALQVREEVENFEAALADYQAQRFAEAKEKFLALQEKSPKVLYKIYLSRIEAFLETPPPKDWDGVYTFTTK